jgi:hypothetical protein
VVRRGAGGLHGPGSPPDQRSRDRFLADALLQGLAGDEAWEWMQQHASDETGELAWERAEHYGVPVGWIKPYPCGDEPDKHNHQGPSDRQGWHSVTYVPGIESDCPDCTFEERPTPPATETENT